MKDPKSTYLQVRLDESKRAILQADVDTGRASSLTSALHARAFGRTHEDDNEITQYLSIISNLYNEICILMRSPKENKAIYELAISQIYTKIDDLKSEAVKLTKYYRGRRR